MTKHVTDGKRVKHLDFQDCFEREKFVLRLNFARLFCNNGVILEAVSHARIQREDSESDHPTPP